MVGVFLCLLVKVLLGENLAQNKNSTSDNSMLKCDGDGYSDGE